MVYEEESDSEPEVEESQYVPEEPIEQEIEQKQEPQAPKRKNRIFEYLKKGAKRNKR